MLGIGSCRANTFYVGPLNPRSILASVIPEHAYPAHSPCGWGRWRLCIGSCRANTFYVGPLDVRPLWHWLLPSMRKWHICLLNGPDGSCASVLAERAHIVSPLDVWSVLASVLPKCAQYARATRGSGVTGCKPAKAVVAPVIKGVAEYG